MWYNCTYRQLPYPGPANPLILRKKGHHQMAHNPIPLFSDFLSMKRHNPNQYWLPATHAQMARSYQHHGPAYFDLHKDQSL